MEFKNNNPELSDVGSDNLNKEAPTDKNELGNALAEKEFDTGELDDVEDGKDGHVEQTQKDRREEQLSAMKFEKEEPDEQNVNVNTGYEQASKDTRAEQLSTTQFNIEQENNSDLNEPDKDDFQNQQLDENNPEAMPDDVKQPEEDSIKEPEPTEAPDIKQENEGYNEADLTESKTEDNVVGASDQTRLNDNYVLDTDESSADQHENSVDNIQSAKDDEEKTYTNEQSNVSATEEPETYTENTQIAKESNVAESNADEPISDTGTEKPVVVEEPKTEDNAPDTKVAETSANATSEIQLQEPEMARSNAPQEAVVEPEHSKADDTASENSDIRPVDDENHPTDTTTTENEGLSKTESSEQANRPDYSFTAEKTDEKFETNDGKTISYQDAVNEITGYAQKYMDENGVDTEKSKAVLSDIENALNHQEGYARARAIGDHGIRHIYENIKRGEAYLDSCDTAGYEVSNDQRLGCLVAQVYHDYGYTDSDVHERKAKNETAKTFNPDKPGEKFVQDSDHDIRSRAHFEAEKEALYKDIFKNDNTIYSVKNAIGDHNIPDSEYISDTRNKKGSDVLETKAINPDKVSDGKKDIKERIDVKSDLVVSTVMLTDKLALTQAEKFSYLLKSEPAFVKLSEGVNTFNNLLKNHPELGFYETSKELKSDGTYKETTVLTKAGKELEASYKEQLKACVNSWVKENKIDEKTAENYTHAIDKDFGLNSGYYSSRMNFVNVPSDCMKKNPDGTTTITIQKIGYNNSTSALAEAQDGQIKKFYEDLGVDYQGASTTQSATDEILKSLGIEVKIEDVSIENTENKKSLSSVHENLNDGDIMFEELNEKVTEVAKVLEEGEIDEDKFNFVKGQLENYDVEYRDLKDEASKRTAIKNMLKEYTETRVHTVVNKILNEEE